MYIYPFSVELRLTSGMSSHSQSFRKIESHTDRESFNQLNVTWSCIDFTFRAQLRVTFVACDSRIMG